MALESVFLALLRFAWISRRHLQIRPPDQKSIFSLKLALLFILFILALCLLTSARSLDFLFFLIEAVPLGYFKSQLHRGIIGECILFVKGQVS